MSPGEASPGGLRFDQPFRVEQIADARKGGLRGIRVCRLVVAPAGALGGEGEIEEPVRVVEGRAEDLAARQILEGGRDAPAQRGRAGVDRQRGGEPRQGRAIGTD